MKTKQNINKDLMINYQLLKVSLENLKWHKQLSILEMDNLVNYLIQQNIENYLIIK